MRLYRDVTLRPLTGETGILRKARCDARAFRYAIPFPGQVQLSGMTVTMRPEITSAIANESAGAMAKVRGIAGGKNAGMARSGPREAGRFQEGARQCFCFVGRQVVRIRVGARGTRQGQPDRRCVLPAVGIGECFDLDLDRLIRCVPDLLDLAQVNLPDKPRMSGVARIARTVCMTGRQLAP